MPSRGVARLLGFKVVSLGPPFLLLVALFAQPLQPHVSRRVGSLT